MALVVAVVVVVRLRPPGPRAEHRDRARAGPACPGRGGRRGGGSDPGSPRRVGLVPQRRPPPSRRVRRRHVDAGKPRLHRGGLPPRLALPARGRVGGHRRRSRPGIRRPAAPGHGASPACSSPRRSRCRWRTSGTPWAPGWAWATAPATAVGLVVGSATLLNVFLANYQALGYQNSLLAAVVVAVCAREVLVRAGTTLSLVVVGCRHGRARARVAAPAPGGRGGRAVVREGGPASTRAACRRRGRRRGRRRPGPRRPRGPRGRAGRRDRARHRGRAGQPGPARAARPGPRVLRRARDEVARRGGPLRRRPHAHPVAARRRALARAGCRAAPLLPEQAAVAVRAAGPAVGRRRPVRSCSTASSPPVPASGWSRVGS